MRFSRKREKPAGKFKRQQQQREKSVSPDKQHNRFHRTFTMYSLIRFVQSQKSNARNDMNNRHNPIELTNIYRDRTEHTEKYMSEKYRVKLLEWRHDGVMYDRSCLVWRS